MADKIAVRPQTPQEPLLITWDHSVAMTEARRLAYEQGCRMAVFHVSWLDPKETWGVMLGNWQALNDGHIIGTVYYVVRRDYGRGR